MSKGRATERGWWVLLMVIAGLSLAVLLGVNDVVTDLKSMAIDEAQAGVWTNEYGTPVPEPTPTPEDIDMTIPTASLSGYADIEASRIAKMAHMMMAMGGEYTAKAEAVYDSVTKDVVTEYSITWRREDTVIDGKTDNYFEQTWTGANWGECIGKMMAWRGGE